MNVLKPHLKTTVLTLLGSGKSIREITRITGVDRKTVRRLKHEATANSPGVATGDASQNPPPRPPGPASTCEPFRAFIEQQLRLRRNYTSIYQDLVDQFGFSGAYNSVKRFATQIVTAEPQLFDRLEFAPGEEAQVDYGEGAPTLDPKTGRYRKPRLFVMTLRYSRRSFRRVVWNSSQETWARLHEEAWRYFGGTTTYVVLDNLKEGVIKPDLYEPAINPLYAAVLAHYHVIPDPARVADPDRKGCVENAIQHTQATALKGRRFESLEAQNAFLEHWETRWAAQRIHGHTRQQVEAMFQEERKTLGPLPLMPFAYFADCERTVCDDGCIRHDHSSYAARPARIGSKVLVRVFEHTLEIRDRQTQALLRTHARAARPGSVVLPDAERLFNPSRETQRILAQAREIGPAADQLCRQLFAAQGRVGQRKLWGIVSLTKRYPRHLVNQACALALHEGVYSYKHILAVTDRLTAEALKALETPLPPSLDLAQSHPLIRDGDDYAAAFSLGAAYSAGPSLSPGDC